MNTTTFMLMILLLIPSIGCTTPAPKEVAPVQIAIDQKVKCIHHEDRIFCAAELHRSRFLRLVQFTTEGGPAFHMVLDCRDNTGMIVEAWRVIQIKRDPLKTLYGWMCQLHAQKENPRAATLRGSRH